MADLQASDVDASAAPDSSGLSERLSATPPPSLTPFSSPLTRLLSDFHLIRVLATPSLRRVRTNTSGRSGRSVLAAKWRLFALRAAGHLQPGRNSSNHPEPASVPFAFSNGAALVSRQPALPPSSRHITPKCKTSALAAYVPRATAAPTLCREQRSRFSFADVRSARGPLIRRLMNWRFGVGSSGRKRIFFFFDNRTAELEEPQSEAPLDSRRRRA